MAARGSFPAPCLSRSALLTRCLASQTPPVARSHAAAPPGTSRLPPTQNASHRLDTPRTLPASRLTLHGSSGGLRSSSGLGYGFLTCKTHALNLLMIYELASEKSLIRCRNYITLIRYSMNCLCWKKIMWGSEAISEQLGCMACSPHCTERLRSHKEALNTCDYIAIDR